VGVLIGQRLAAPSLRAFAAEVENVGFGAFWFGEGLGREAFTQAAVILAATRRVVVGTSIANIYVRDAVTARNAANTLAEAWPDRFVLGLGVSHRPYVETRGHVYVGAATRMGQFLDAFATAPAYSAVPPDNEPPIVLAALGPRMLHLARERTSGAISFLVDSAATADARRILGADKYLGVIVPVALAGSRTRARQVGGAILRQHLTMPVYRANLSRMGYAAGDLAADGSDRLFDAVVPWGDAASVAAAVGEYLAAGADHIAINITTPEPDQSPIRELAALAGHLIG
jgi:probable F420-dependent oxidoreductase